MPITYVSCLLVAFLKCIPFQKQWQINPNPGSELVETLIGWRSSLPANRFRFMYACRILPPDHLCHGNELGYRLVLDGDSTAGMSCCGCWELSDTANLGQMIWRAHMPWKKKLSLLIMFSGGFLELTFGVLRCVSVLTVLSPDYMYAQCCISLTTCIGRQR